MRKKLQTILASALVVVVAAVPVFANVTGLMTSTSTTMTTEPVVDPDPDVPEQKLPDYFIDLKEGLKAGENYSGISVNVDAKVQADKAAVEFTLDGKTYTSLYTVQGSDPKASPNDGAVPTSGNYVKIVPERDGIFTVVTNYIGNTGSDKTVWFVHEVKGGTPEAQSYTTSKTEADVKSYEVKAGESYYFYAKGSNAMIAGLGIKYGEAPKPDTIVAVTDITGIAAKMTAGETITLAGTVAPANATNKTIVWSIKDAGATGATLSGNRLTAQTAGSVTVTATIANGAGADKAYTKDFTIVVEAKPVVDTTVAVTGITGVVTEMTAGETITLAGTVAPENATNKTIVWSIKDAGTTGATLSGDQLTTQTAGTVVVTATIEKGLSATEAYTQDFTIEVKAAVKLGDVNGDTEIDSKDALAVLKYALNIEQDNFVEEAADVNRDTVIDSKDALAILKHSLGIELIQ